MTAPDIRTLARRISVLEQRLNEIEQGYGESICRLSRRAIRTDIRLGRMAKQMGVPSATEAEVDAVLESEG